MSACNILAYNTLRLRKPNWQMSRGSKIIHIPEKQKDRNTVQTAVWSAPLKYSNIDIAEVIGEQAMSGMRPWSIRTTPEDTGFEENSVQNLPTLAKTYGVPPEVRRKLRTESAGNGIIVPSWNIFSCYLKIWRERAGWWHSPKSGQHVTPETLCQTGGYRLKSQTFLSENPEFVFGFARKDTLFIFSAHGKTKSVL